MSKTRRTATEVVNCNVCSDVVGLKQPTMLAWGGRTGDVVLNYQYNIFVYSINYNAGPSFEDSDTDNFIRAREARDNTTREPKLYVLRWEKKSALRYLDDQSSQLFRRDARLHVAWENAMKLPLHLPIFRKIYTLSYIVSCFNVSLNV